MRGEEENVLPTTLTLIDHSVPLVRAWRETFAEVESVTVVEGDFFSVDADAMVSPANSFGFMDGGLDAAIRATLGGQVQSAVQARILDAHHGELPIGSAEIVPTGHARWPFLVLAPTMRIPESVANTLNAYLAFRAALLAVARFNATGSAPIRSVVVPGLGTGIGAMDPRRCAAQMRIAWDQVSKPARIGSANLIHALHHKLRSAM